MKIYRDIFMEMISLENLFTAWDMFRRGKGQRREVMEFEFNLEQNIFEIHKELKNATYRHGDYTSFSINDPKPRKISKARVRDRLVHQAIFNILNPIFEPSFIANSFSNRIGKGTHAGVEKLAWLLRQESQNFRKPCLALKCDIKKFFDSVNHEILMKIIGRRVIDPAALNLIREIVESFEKTPDKGPPATGEARRAGLPLGNLTSQIFANIYLNELDQFIKHKLKVKKYVRYTDDFLIVSADKKYLEKILPALDYFLRMRLNLTLHPQKIVIRKFRQGLDFLGYVSLPRYRLLRAKTRQRIWRKIKTAREELAADNLSNFSFQQTFNSYLGVLSHADTFRLEQELKNVFWPGAC
jgi:RNA-directed DNA polymerase